MGTMKERISPSQAKRLTGGIPSSQDKYNKLLNAKLDKMGYYTRASQLYAETKQSDRATPEQTQRLIDLDEEKAECMKVAEQACRKLRMGTVPYSKQLNNMGGRWHFWKMVVALKVGKKRSRSQIKRLAKAVGVIAPLSVTLT